MEAMCSYETSVTVYKTSSQTTADICTAVITSNLSQLLLSLSDCIL
jgi:hypothetical protein